MTDISIDTSLATIDKLINRRRADIQSASDWIASMAEEIAQLQVARRAVCRASFRPVPGRLLPAPQPVGPLTAKFTPSASGRGEGTPEGPPEGGSVVGAATPVSQSVAGCKGLTRAFLGNSTDLLTTDPSKPTTSEAENDD